MEQVPETLDITPLSEQLAPLTNLAPFFLIGSVGVLALLLVVAILSTRRHRRQYQAILQTAEDTHAIRELLENQQLRTTNIPQRADTQADDLQLPPRP